MSIIVPSRFACLKSDEEETPKAPKPVPTKENGNNKIKKDIKKNATNANNKPTNKKQKAAKVATAKQWEEWKQKDETLVNGNFEQDMESALMLSKMHYEENKDKYSKVDVPKGKKPEKKKSAKKTISLDVFLAGESSKGSSEIIKTSSETDSKETKENFFEKNLEDVKEVLIKEKLQERVRQRQNVMDEVISSAQYHERLELERNKNEALQNELDQCRKEVISVKERNKTLYNLLSTGEMKGKAEIINELAKLTVIKDELTQEVTRLHGLLEQERSKVAALINEKQSHKKSGKKH